MSTVKTDSSESFVLEISKKSISPLARFITGDIEQTPYLTGLQLVELFNEHGSDDVYEFGKGTFPSRWMYVEQKLEIINGSDNLKAVLEDLIDDRFYIDKDEDLETAVKYLNDIIKFDGYQAERVEFIYKIISIRSDQNIKTQKPKGKGKGGRPRDPKQEEKKKSLSKDFYKLTQEKGYRSSKAIKILAEKYKWAESTVETYLKK